MAFELLAASLRASSGDLETFVRVLAEKLDQALPGRARIERRAARFLSKQTRVERIERALGEGCPRHRAQDRAAPARRVDRVALPRPRKRGAAERGVEACAGAPAQGVGP